MWVGFTPTQTSMRPPATPIKVFGGTYPAQIWHQFMAAALAGRAPGCSPSCRRRPPRAPPGSVVRVPPTSSGLGPLVHVPEVVGMTVEEATAALENAGFVVETAIVDVAKQKAGHVVGAVAAGGPERPAALHRHAGGAEGSEAKKAT